MPLFHFHLAGETRERDCDGLDLPDLAAAREAATRYAGEILRDDPHWLGASGQSRVEVTDDQDTLLCTLVMLAIDAPAVDRLNGAGYTYV